MEKIKVLFLSKNKPTCHYALDCFINGASEDGWDKFELIGVGTENFNLEDEYHHDEKLIKNIPTYSNKELYEKEIKADLVISYLYPRLIKEPLISRPKLGCINFHPAPLPKYRGVANYARAILNEEKEFGVSAHYVDESFDTGDIIEVRLIKIDPRETSYSLEFRSLRLLQDLFYDTMLKIAAGENLSRVPQQTVKDIIPVYTKISDIDKLRTVYPSDTAEDIDKKIRAFWFPPMGGARVIVDGKEFTLINQQLLDQINRWKNTTNDHDVWCYPNNKVKLYD